MTFAVGDAIHVKSLGKGVVREVRNSERYLVEVNGRSIVTTGDQLTHLEVSRKTARTKTAPPRSAASDYAPTSDAAPSLDLHGLTVDEAFETVAEALNRALLAGASELRVIHGRSGGKLKAALHKQLKSIGSVRGFTVDPRNAGVTIVKL